jgi:hypothetical protein
MTLQEKIDAAEKALHDLMTGGATVRVQDGDTMLQYQPADAAKLRAYIDDLKTQSGSGGGRTRARRVFF